ncbi:UDP-N-acetylmuramoylalanine--D-glutamate ligase [Chitinophaga costaii]|uniref:UDP-N-acetylmuramoylalanine--D-glutamate ligase n=1 Tax=Chitinophaga costaii TaxID=1335309 RepID=A0A1C4BUA4_9BACT|nr:UDP-N-acetylmuramoyl-L-alanine--D-glutamate ligase [Chitinophaga costaii]PUZ27472.1 UDP-N-acetylmuramoyl-L-alanine--D-glutamate ligase [Chitinophaga costaii]SCC10323.1 UDP-N-acetylmuramoylalanine--D-glutamate ligase [Chitinophaga costaii]
MAKLIILGAGESGVGAALLGKQQGYEVFVSDGGPIKDIYKHELTAHAIEFEESQHSWERILAADEIVKSPGIPEKSEVMKKIRATNISVISEIELAWRYSKDAKIIAITGSNGKSTTTALTYHIFHNAGLPVAMVGNIGISYAKQVATDPQEYYVIEISSFQLDDIKDFRPHVAILLNITPDHLDRYNYKMEHYVASKFRIAMNQVAGDYFIYCKDDPEIMNYLKNHSIHSTLIPFTIMEPLKEGGSMTNDQINITVNGDTEIVSMYDLALKGKHNIYNSMAAGIAGRTMNIRKEKIRESLASFKSLEHRMEFVATVRGVDFINDSKATNVNSVWFALESIENRPIILIMGGVDKGNDYSAIRELVKERVKAIICLGVDNQPIQDALGKEVATMISTSSMEDAVKAAFQQSNKGDVVLLSPACASFDLFKNYEDRGRKFKEVVREL